VANWTKRHRELVEAVNAATTEDARSSAKAHLSGFREAVSDLTGVHPGHLIMEADWFYIEAGVDRPMCGGVWLDWKPAPAPGAAPSGGEGER
jgi:hypothetical protein